MVTRVCVSVSLSVRGRMPTLLHGPDVTWKSGRRCPLVVHYWADLQSVHGLRCYGNITRTRNVSEYMFVLALCLVFVCNFVKNQLIFNAVFSVRFWNEQYMWRREIHPPHLINVAILPCESRNTENACKTAAFNVNYKIAVTCTKLRWKFHKSLPVNHINEHSFQSVQSVYHRYARTISDSHATGQS